MFVVAGKLVLRRFGEETSLRIIPSNDKLCGDGRVPNGNPFVPYTTIKGIWLVDLLFRRLPSTSPFFFRFYTKSLDRNDVQEKDFGSISGQLRACLPLRRDSFRRESQFPVPHSNRHLSALHLGKYASR